MGIELAVDAPDGTRRIERTVEVDFERALIAARALGGVAALDSSGGSPRRWSLVGFDPLARAEGCARLADLRPLLARAAAIAPRPDRPFTAGFLGALAYDLGVAGEGQVLPVPPWSGPAIAGGLFTDHFSIDHRAGTCRLQLIEVADDPRGPLEPRLERAVATLEESQLPSGSPRPVGPLRRHVPGALHRERVDQLRARIKRGEVYQANLAHRSTVDLDGDPLALYLALRTHNPAPYAGYLEFTGGDGVPRALLSSSPELLVESSPGTARTRPIKGTSPRHVDPAADSASATALLASEKDRAELAMIVDLARNDLGRLAVPGGVRVGPFPELDSYASVHHLMADVRADLRPEVDAVTLLESLFPAASISGAPKLAAMEAIAELEGEGRGYFSGSLGWIDVSGAARFNVLIRTLEWRATPSGGEVSLSVGGGITWDSVPEAEERETLDKARALLAALGCEGFEAR